MDNSDWKGHLVLVVAGPGAGKSTLISYLREINSEISFAVSCTSRPIRPGEVEGENYYFISVEEFQQRIAAGKFLEWIQQDGGRYYGTLKSEIIDKIKAGGIVIREVEIRGADAIRELVPKENLSIIFISAGSWEDMAERIKTRAPMSDKELEFRCERYEKERLFSDKADYIITNSNGKLEEAKKEFKQIIDNIVSKIK